MTTGRINQVAILVVFARANKTQALGQVVFHISQSLDGYMSSEESMYNNRRSSVAFVNVPQKESHRQKWSQHVLYYHSACSFFLCRTEARKGTCKQTPFQAFPY